MSINIERCAERALVVFKDQGWQVQGEEPTKRNLIRLISSMALPVLAKDVEPGDFYFHATNRIRVQKAHYGEDNIIETEVTLLLGDEYDDYVEEEL